MDKIILPLNDSGNPPIADPVIPKVIPDVNKTTELVIGTDKYNVNSTGDAVDTTGKIIKTKVELDILKTTSLPTDEEKEKTRLLTEKTTAIEAQLIEGAEVELDEKKYKLNKDGSAIDETGKVIKTKAEIKAMMLEAESTPEDVNYINEIQKTTNLIVLGENGQPATYENTLPGITQFTQDVHKEGVKLGRTQYEQELTTKFPILTPILEHLTIHGSLNGFNEAPDYSKLTVTDDENQQIDIYTRAKLEQGVPQAEITTMLGYLKTDKKLKEAAESSLTYLKTTQESINAERTTTAATVKAKEELDAKKYWADVHAAINSRQLVVGDKKFIIPEVIRVKTADGKAVVKTGKDFLDYIEKPQTFVIDGQNYTMTGLQYDEYKEETTRTPHNDIFDAFRKFTKYDDAQIISANVSNNVVKNVIKLKSKSGSGSSGTSGGAGKINLPIK